MVATKLQEREREVVTKLQEREQEVATKLQEREREVAKMLQERGRKKCSSKRSMATSTSGNKQKVRKHLNTRRNFKELMAAQLGNERPELL